VARRTIYRVAGGELTVEAGDAWAAEALDTLFAGWYITAVRHANDADTPALVVRGDATPPEIPESWPRFDVAGGGTCATRGRAAYIAIDRSVITIADGTPIALAIDGRLPLDSPALTRLVTYALSAALRRHGRFELHSGGVVIPASGRGLLIVGPSGSGKSTLTVHLAAAGWPFLTDDVLLLAPGSAGVTAWPLRRSFAITPQTFGASAYLQARTTLANLSAVTDKQSIAPHALFAGGFRDCAAPAALIFAELTGAARTEVAPLSPGDAMARLIRMSPWSAYDRATAPAHLAALSALAKQAPAHALRAGRDLLDPEASVRAVTAVVGGAARVES
jgi:hypothetical protein